MTYYCISALEFSDGSIALNRLYSGSLADCRTAMENIPAITYNGPEKGQQAGLRIIDQACWDALEGQAK